MDWLAKAVVKAKESLPQVNFDIYGTGAEEAKLRAIIEENQAQDYIHLKGHQDLTEVYKDYELYLSGSKSEGFGLTLLEAVGSGLGMIGLMFVMGTKPLSRIMKMGTSFLVLKKMMSLLSWLPWQRKL